ncbi:dTDP-4-dehydrorhamnose 3,5-epimerase family protein [Streptomyces sp. NPDC060006]|uniref:dTDP-4-dehydrorhamnose 3,5-epimerase family protein n=1 Tax=unclassified Streptomyces TaxID=2593676 RepID=UPI0036A2CD14
MDTRQLKIAGALEFTPDVFPDDRGYFLSSFQEQEFNNSHGQPLFPVAQISYSLSHRGVVRGVHYTATPPGTAKYVFCPRGRVLDVIVDLRVGSPTFGEWDSVELGGTDQRAVYLPVGVGHMFIVLEDDSLMNYTLSSSYVAEHELAVSPLDPALALPLPTGMQPVLSERDREAPTLAEAESAGLLPSFETSLALDAALGGPAPVPADAR